MNENKKQKLTNVLGVILISLLVIGIYDITLFTFGLISNIEWLIRFYILL